MCASLLLVISCLLSRSFSPRVPHARVRSSVLGGILYCTLMATCDIDHNINHGNIVPLQYPNEPCQISRRGVRESPQPVAFYPAGSRAVRRTTEARGRYLRPPPEQDTSLFRMTLARSTAGPLPLGDAPGRDEQLGRFCFFVMQFTGLGDDFVQ